MTTGVLAAQGLELGLVGTAFTLGLRHGIDWDHVVAIGDLASASNSRRRSLVLATLYIAGHALVLFTLGTVAVVAGDVVPPGVDAAMLRVVGATLLVLGVVIAVGLVREGRGFRMRSRWLVLGGLLRAGIRRVRRSPVVIEHEHSHSHDHDHAHVHREPAMSPATTARVAVVTEHRHRHVHVGEMPDDPFAGRGRIGAVVVGMLHGVGAETPTQVLVLVSAIGAGGIWAGEVVLLAFTAGLVLSNSALAIAATAASARTGRGSPAYLALAGFTAVFSIVLGSLYLLGIDVLPALAA